MTDTKTGEQSIRRARRGPIMTATVRVENLLYGGRSLVGFTEEGERVAGWPEVAYESSRAINHLTGHGPIPAPTAYQVLGDLKGLGHQLPQA